MMKLLFFSSDAAEVERTCRELDEAGIPCEIRNGSADRGEQADSLCAELWLHNDQDTHRALMRCAEQGVGFYRRSSIPSWRDEEEEEAQSRPTPTITNSRHRSFLLSPAAETSDKSPTD